MNDCDLHVIETPVNYLAFVRPVTMRMSVERAVLLPLIVSLVHVATIHFVTIECLNLPKKVFENA